ncbi:OsmC family protein [Sphingomonas canadensis]|uniref:OsmC family protein n=1 Tax=Sphingomonas canadensis TaxID=1219257 RepID=A0ABW3H903_9SPHN|nr:OsmC family protein [Sphingomonas canadensis]MCW3837063.1 OsmC family protein [Sphingomonas canadensis]
MSLYEATVEWRAGGGEPFLSRKYSRAHRWKFDGGADVPASASPQVVRVPFSDPAGVDPEEALVAALASCHMLFFLDLASRAGLDVVSYTDRATGEMGTREDGRVAMVKAILHPQVVFAGEADPDNVAAVHQRAHELCYIANSVNFPVSVEPIS